MVSCWFLIMAGLWAGLIISEPSTGTIWALLLLNLLYFSGVFGRNLLWPRYFNYERSFRQTANTARVKDRRGPVPGRPRPNTRQRSRPGRSTRSVRSKSDKPLPSMSDRAPTQSEKQDSPASQPPATAVQAVTRSDFALSSPNFMRKNGVAYIVCTVCGVVFG